MSYIVQRNHRFYVVAYHGHDPITGRERRRWHPAGSDPDDAAEVRRCINRQRPKPSCSASLGGFMSTTWLATKRTLTRATANRYRWMIDRNIAPCVDHDGDFVFAHPRDRRAGPPPTASRRS